MKFTITISRDEDGMYIAECPSIPGCVSQGKTEEEAQANIQDAIRECLQVRAEMGIPLTISTRELEVFGLMPPVSYFGRLKLSKCLKNSGGVLLANAVVT